MRQQKKIEFAPEMEFYQSYSTEEDKARTNVHYEHPVAYFNAITGGRWNVYSCNLWEGTTDDTESQEAKLDLMARLMDLQPGQRILDVGCGWGGPLTYLCQKYKTRGVGLTLSPTQKKRMLRNGRTAKAWMWKSSNVTGAIIRTPKGSTLSRPTK